MFLILFHESMGIDQKSQEPILGFRYYERVARQMGVTQEQLFNAFKVWAENGYPEMYRYFLFTRMGTNKPYKVCLRIWNYQGDQGRSSTGYIHLERSYGKGWRTIDNCYCSFMLGMVV